MAEESSSHHNPEHRKVFRDAFGLEPCVAFPQEEPICKPKPSKDIRHEENTSRLANEGEIAMPLDLTVPARRSMGEIKKPQLATSLATIAPLTLISPNEQLVQQSYIPQRQNYSLLQCLLTSSDHYGGRRYQDLYLQGETVLIEGDEFVCSVCNLRLPNHADLQQHEQMHTSELSSTSNKFYRNVTGNNELLQHNESRMGERSFSSTECEKIFSRKSTKKSNLLQHQQMHTSERPYKCDFSVHASATKDNLKIHQRKHTGKRPFKCETCGSAFFYSNNLTNHRRIHTGERPFKCEFCGYAFAQSSTLTNHRRTHTGERPYKCKVCNYEAAWSNSLRSHMMVRHRTHESSNIETSADSPAS